MAQDERYQVAIYMQEGANLSGATRVIGSGGVDSFESGAVININSGAQLDLSGAADVNINSGATLVIASGATMSMVSGAVWGIAGANVAAADVRRILASELAGTVIIGQGAASTVLSVVNLPANVRTVILSGTSTMVAGSFWLTSVSAGREVVLMFGGGSTSTASGAVVVSLSGCSLLGSVGLVASGFTMNMSASHCMVHLRAVEDNVWAIIGEYGDVDE